MVAPNKFPPDIEKDWDEVREEGAEMAQGLKAKAANVADKVSERVRDGYERSVEAVSEFDPIETAREGSDAVIRAVERHPVVAFGLGALSVGLIAWASLRDSRRWYEPDIPAWRRMLNDYGSEAAHTGEGLLKSGRKWFDSSSAEAQDYADQARGYARQGGRYLMHRTEREPLAAIVGIGLAVYVVGSLLSAATSDARLPAPPARRRSTKR